MKKEHRELIKSLLAKYSKEAKFCLYPERDYAWGTKPKNRNRTIALMNSICGEIPSEVWPQEEDDCVIIKNGIWRLDLTISDEGEKYANLIYHADDHTAWVVQAKDGAWKDFDIGGS